MSGSHVRRTDPLAVIVSAHIKQEPQSSKVPSYRISEWVSVAAEFGCSLVITVAPPLVDKVFRVNTVGLYD